MRPRRSQQQILLLRPRKSWYCRNLFHLHYVIRRTPIAGTVEDGRNDSATDKGAAGRGLDVAGWNGWNSVTFAGGLRRGGLYAAVSGRVRMPPKRVGGPRVVGGTRGSELRRPKSGVANSVGVKTVGATAEALRLRG